MTTDPQTDPETGRLHDKILGLEAELAKMRDLLRTENQRANAAIEREETAEQAAPEAQQERDQLRAELDVALKVAAVRPAPAVSSPPPDQTELRDRIAAAIIESDGVPSYEFAAKLHRAAALREADAVLSVLSPPADQAALERVRTVLETEAVVGRSALEYRGLILSALMAAEAQQPAAADTDPDPWLDDPKANIQEADLDRVDKEA